MAINSMSFNRATTTMISSTISPTETETKNILNQIASKQQSLNRLSSDSEVSADEKAKERQEIRKQIAELNRKLRMLRMEKAEEAKKAEKEQEQKSVLNEEQMKEIFHEDADEDSGKGISAETTEEQQKKNGISPQNIQKLLEVEGHIQKERIQQSVSHKKELAENILETEIATDELRGTNTTAKKEKLDSMIKEKPFEIKLKEQQKTQLFSEENTLGKIIIREDEV